MQLTLYQKGPVSIAQLVVLLYGGVGVRTPDIPLIHLLR